MARSHQLRMTHSELHAYTQMALNGCSPVNVLLLFF